MDPGASSPDAASGAVFVLACGALAREIEWLVNANDLDVTVEYLPARLHNTPGLIPALVDERLTTAAGSHRVRFVAYGDCGTGGLLDAVLDRHGVVRLEGAHCYEVFAGDLFARLQDEEPGTFYLTDYLTRHFDRLVWRGLGLDRNPALRDMLFRNYQRVVYLSQTEDPHVRDEAEECAERLGLEFVHRHVGLGSLGDALKRFGAQQGVA